MSYQLCARWYISQETTQRCHIIIVEASAAVSLPAAACPEPQWLTYSSCAPTPSPEKSKDEASERAYMDKGQTNKLTNLHIQSSPFPVLRLYTITQIFKKSPETMHTFSLIGRALGAGMTGLRFIFWRISTAGAGHTC